MKVIFIRHASIKYEGDSDTLTEIGQKYSENLPKILKDSGYETIDHIYYVSHAQSNREITRCFETIKKIECKNVEKIKWNEYPLMEVDNFKDETIVICYIKKLLSKLPIEPYNKQEFIKDKTETDKLYENIIATKYNYESKSLKIVNNINTNDKSENNQ
ncbi:histidine phosphatase family protein [Flavivirga rizhaonensis]|uniref:Uncharacterized protein n=1 Tax=Flavivirga rizhaonensis TaxID=2559571 RepID=A0A4S1DRT6_9FLAO|nr:histidine phosphatase family protein [Flavivirga rizhaonensis]TGV00656.1 hypothetical protein EM932_18770 [Flavivirga rizhaonensis]